MITLLLTFFYLFAIANAVEEFRSATALKNISMDGIIKYSSSGELIQGIWLSECAMKCLSADCESFFYNSLSKSCHLNRLDVDFSSGAVSESGWQFYRMNTVSPSVCPADYEYNSSPKLCFKVYDSTLPYYTYAAKVAFCQTNGGNLVKIDSAEKQDIIESHLASMYNSISSFVIVQGERTGFNGQFLYTTGSGLTWSNWDLGQPGSTEYYIGIGKNFNYKWHDITYEISSSSFICELPV